MGCCASSSSTMRLDSRVPSPSAMRFLEVKEFRRGRRKVKLPPIPNFTAQEQKSLQTNYSNFLAATDPGVGINLFTLIIIKSPRTFTRYFVESGSNSGTGTQSPDEGDASLSSSAPFTNAKFLRHQESVSVVLKNCVLRAVNNDLSDIQAPLRRIGATHAERGVRAKDLLLFEDSFIWALLNTNIQVSNETLTNFRILIRYILFNIVAGLNSHNEKLEYILSPFERSSICSGRCLIPKSPPSRIVDKRTSVSMRRLSVNLKSRDESRQH